MKAQKWVMAVIATAGLTLFGDTKTVDGKEYVYLLAPDTSNTAGQNSIVLGTRWSDGVPPHDDADYLVDLGAGNYIRAFAGFGSLNFAGRSLTLGTVSDQAGWLYWGGCRPLSITNLYCVKGGMRLETGANWSRLTSTNMTVQATANDPFIIEASGRNEVNLNARVFGGSDAVLLIRAADGARCSPDIFRVKNENEYWGFTNYFGKIIVEGTNVYFGVTHNSMAFLPPCALGFSPGDAFVVDALTLRDGGAFELNSAYSFPFAAGNRGIRVGEGGGELVLSATSLGGRAISARISGPGVLSVKGGVTFWNGTFDCGGLFVASNGAVRVDDTMAWGDGMTLEVAAGGTFVGTAAEMRPARTVLHGGAKVVLGVAHGARYLNFGNPQLFRPLGWTVGTLRLSSDSVLSLDEQPLSLQLEDDGVGAVYAGRIPLMRVPTSVRTLTNSDFTLLAADGTASTRAVEIVTEGSEQVVYAVSGSSVYVVPSGTAGNTPAVPYDTWATAATNLATAIAGANVGDTVRVAPGVYYPTNALTLSSAVTIVSDDGSGALATGTTIFDGGGTETNMSCGHRLFSLVGAGACIKGLTIRNGFDVSKGGGVYLASSGATVIDCVISNCYATNTSWSASGGGIHVSGTPLVQGTRIVGCKSNGGGGASSDVTVFTAYQDRDTYPRFVDCAFIGNEGTRSDGTAIGGGLYASSVWVEDSVFEGNWLTSTTGSGSSARRGPGVYCTPYTVITNCTFDANGGGQRGVITSDTSPVTLRGCVFRNHINSSALIGLSGTNSLAANCVFTNNSVALLGLFGERLRLRNCLYANNGMPFDIMSGLAENCTVVSNRCGGIHVSGDTYKPTFVNCISACNSEQSGLSNVRGRPNFYFFKLAPVTNLTVISCCFQGVSGMTNTYDNTLWDPLAQDAAGASFDAGPKFVNVENGNYRLTASSPCRDRGATLEWMAAGTDLDGNSRLLDYNGKATADALPDIGCYECFEKVTRGTVVIVR